MKKIISLIIAIAVIVVIHFYMNIGGWAIKNINKLTDASYITVVVRDEQNKAEYELTSEQARLLQALLKENSYKRRFSSTVIGVLPENEYTILADWNDDGKTNLYIKILGGEYISFYDHLGNKYHKIKNPDFKKELLNILESE